MKTIEEFQAFYKNNLQSELDSIDTLRKSTIKQIIKRIFIFILIIAVVLLIGALINSAIYGSIFLENNDDIAIPMIIAVIVSFILILTLPAQCRSIKKKFTIEFKKRVIEPIIHFIHEDLKYEPTNYIPQNVFIKSKIFTQYPDKYYGDDYVSGVIDKTEIMFSEVHAKYKYSSSDDDKDEYAPLFDGLFCVADFHKNFNGKYFVLPDFAERKFGKIGQMFQKIGSSHGKLIQLENPEFEKIFAVYGSDQVEARYILSSSMMQRLVDFQKKCNKTPSLSFVDSSVFVAIPYKKALFETKLISSVANQEKITSYFEDLQLVIGIVEDLNLNTRIWSKT